jgi:hypothetical protein
MDPPAHHQESSDSTSHTVVYTPTTKKIYELQFTGFLRSAVKMLSFIRQFTHLHSLLHKIMFKCIRLYCLEGTTLPCEILGLRPVSYITGVSMVYQIPTNDEVHIKRILGKQDSRHGLRIHIKPETSSVGHQYHCTQM